jgi:hypothetical protein
MVSAVDKKHVQIVYLWLQEQRDRGACRRLNRWRAGPVIRQLVANPFELVVKHSTDPS